MISNTKQSFVGGFTLIELLVVIAIISLLSSTVLTAISDVRNRARIAAGKQFEQNIRASISDCSEAFYNFEGSSNSTVREASGYSGRDGTINGDPQRVDSLSGLGQAMKFDGSGDYVEVPDSYLDDTFTASVWVKPSVVQNAVGILGNSNYLDGGFHIGVRYNPPKILTFAVNDNGNAYNVGASDYSFTSDKWTHITASFDGSTQRFYINGTKSYEQSSNISSSNNPFLIGSTPQGGWSSFDGVIDNVRIYDCALEGDN